MKSKFYATFKGINSREIAVFKTEQERDAWVNYQDPFSVLDKEAKDYMLPRKALSTCYAIRRIKETIYKTLVNDDCNSNQKWYLLGGVS